MTKLSDNIVMIKKKIESYMFGHDIDNIKDVQDYVIENYDEEDYNIHIAQGDDVMNSLTINRAEDQELDALIDSCYGEGDFEE